MKKSVVLSVFLLVSLSLTLGCDKSPQRSSDPEILANMAPFEEAWFAIAEDVGIEMKDRHEKLSKFSNLPADYEWLQRLELTEKWQNYIDELNGLDYAEKDPYKTAVKDMEKVFKKVIEAKEAVFAEELYAERGENKPSAIMGAGRTIKETAYALQDAAWSIGIPKSEWPEWVKEYRK